MSQPDGHALDRKFGQMFPSDRFALVARLRRAGVTGRPCIHVRERLVRLGIIEPCLVCIPSPASPASPSIPPSEEPE